MWWETIITCLVGAIKFFKFLMESMERLPLLFYTIHRSGVDELKEEKLFE
jgi:hypothetical protein